VTDSEGSLQSARAQPEIPAVSSAWRHLVTDTITGPVLLCLQDNSPPARQQTACAVLLCGRIVVASPRADRDQDCDAQNRRPVHSRHLYTTTEFLQDCASGNDHSR